MSDTLERFQRHYPLIIEFDLRWGEMDAFNHINNVAYFRYFECARIAYFERTQIMVEMRQKKIGPILAETQCQYRRPLTYPDRILVGAVIDELHSYGFRQSYGIYSTGQDTIATTGSGRIVLLDYKTQQKVPVSEPLVDEVNRFQDGLQPLVV
ncbi:MAG: acyl-CoA thioesterase [Saccharospirillum sp.]